MAMSETQKDGEGTERPAPDPVAASRFWQMQLEYAERQHKDFWKTGDSIIARYRAEKDAIQKRRTSRRFGILYSNTETVRSALYGKAAKPDVRRKHSQKKDVVARTGAEMLERALGCLADNSKHDRAFETAVLDRCLPGRGVVRIMYEPVIVKDQTGQDVIADQKFYEVFVANKDFLHSPARTWDDVWWVGFCHKMTRDDLKTNGFESAETVPLNWAPEGTERQSSKDVPDDVKRAEVWEIWSKSTKQRFWIVKGHAKALRIDEDPYKLEEFFPCAEPLQAVVATDSFVPTPDFEQYKDQADDLDEITERISRLTRELKRRGVYDASIPELKRLAKAGDNEFIASPNMSSFLASKNGLSGAFQTEDISVAAQVLVQLYQTRDMLVQSIYEVTGISDILRGSSDAGETATAQQIKANFGSLRVKRSQRAVQRWIRDSYRIKAELICEHIEPQMLMEISGVMLKTKEQIMQEKMAEQQQAMLAQQQAQMQGGMPGAMPAEPGEMPEAPDAEAEPDSQDDVAIDDVMAVLRSDKLRSYRVDIETDSTVFEDSEAEKNARVEVIGAIGDFMQKSLPVAQAVPQLTPLIFEMLSFGVRSFKAGRVLEDTIDEVREQIAQAQANPPPPPPDPAAEKLKMDREAHDFEMQARSDELEAKKQERAQQMEFKWGDQKMKLAVQAAQAGLDPSQILAMPNPAGTAPQQDNGQMLAMIDRLARMAMTPKRIVRDESGRAMGIEPVAMN